MLKEGKFYIPRNEALMLEVIQSYYDVLVAGYGRKWKTIELVMRKY